MILQIDGSDVTVTEDVTITKAGVKYLFPNAGTEIYNLALLYSEYYYQSFDYFLIKHTIDFYVKHQASLSDVQVPAGVIETDEKGSWEAE